MKTFLIRQIFDFITNFSIKDEKQELQSLINKLEENTNEEDEENDKIFQNIHIPRTLQEIGIKDMEKDFEKMKNKGKEEDLLYAKLTGVMLNNQEQGENNNKLQRINENLNESEEEINITEKNNDSDENESESESEKSKKKVGGKQKYEGLSKSERKEKVKDEKREKRKNKMSKKVKKQLLKKN